MKFGDKLIALRKKSGMSQEELAEKLGVSRQSVSKWESNNTYPETDKIVQICNIFDCSMDDLINDNIQNIENIERKSKNNLNVVFDSFLEFVTKTINMFSDMKFVSGLKCVLEMFILGLILFIIGAIIVEFTNYIVSELFSFVPNIIGNVFYNLIESIIIILLVVISLIILVHVFKVRYLDYYDKVLDETESRDNKEKKQEIIKQEKKQKIKLEKKPKIIIRDENHRPFAFLSILSKMIMFFIKIMLIFFAIILMFILLVFIVLTVISISLITTHIFFVGSTLALISVIALDIILIILIINFIFDKKSNYKIMIIIFMSSLIFIGIGIGISTISLKNLKVLESDPKLITKEENLKFDNNMVITNENLGDIEYEYDDSLVNDIKLEIEYDDRFNTYTLSENEYYKMNEIYIYSTSSTKILKIYKDIIQDLKSNTIRDYDYVNKTNVKVISSKSNVEKLIENTKKVYIVDEIKTENGYVLSNIEHKISGYTECHGEYNAKTNEVSSNIEGCSCDKEEEITDRGTFIDYYCELDN